MNRTYPMPQKNILIIVVISLVMVIIPMVGMSSQKYEAFGSSPTIVNVSHDNGISHSEKILASGNNVYLVWLNGTSTDPPGIPPKINDVLFAKSTDGGSTFSIPIKISNAHNDDSSPPVIAQNGNNIYISWIQSNSGNPSLNFARSIDGGITFSNPIQINQGISGPQEEYIATNGNNVYIAFTNSASAGVFFVSSADGGISFTVPQQMSSGSNNHDPKILVEVTNVYLAWDDQNNGVYFRKSIDSGNTFGNPINISQGIQGGGTDIAISGNYIYAAWYNFGVSNQILFARSTDDGNSFGNIITVSTSSISGFFPQLAASGNNVYLTWQQEIPTSPYYDVDIATSSDNGNTFNYPVDITSGTIESHSPQINATSNNVYLSWQGYHPNPDVFYSSSTNGLTFTSPSNISQDNLAQNPQLASSQNNVYLAWQDNSAGNGDIYVASQNPGMPQSPSTMLTITNSTGNNVPVQVGQPVTYDFYEKNTGNVGLSNVGVTFTNPTRTTLCVPSYVDGDVSNTNILDPGETWHYQCTFSYNSVGYSFHYVIATGTTPSGQVITCPGDSDECKFGGANIIPSSTSVPSSTGAGNVLFTPSAGVVTSLSTSSSLGSGLQIPGGAFPYGFFSWTAPVVPGGSLTMTMTFPGPVPPGSLWVKAAGPPMISTQVSPNTISITIIDNGLGDENSALGIISDPAGLMIPTVGRTSGEGNIGVKTNLEFQAISDVEKNHSKITGNLGFKDSSAKINFDSNKITFLSVNPAISQATFVGTGKLDGKNGNYNFMVSLSDPDKKGEHDIFSITISDLTGKVIYQNSGNVKGHIEIHKFADKDDKSDSGKQDHDKDKNK